MYRADKNVVDTSGADADLELELDPIADQGYLIFGYNVVLTAAAAGNDAAVEVRDEDDTVYWRDSFGNAAPVGSKCQALFPNPIELPRGKGAKLFVAALGAGAIAEATLQATTY